MTQLSGTTLIDRGNEMLASGQTKSRTVSEVVLKHRSKGAPIGPRLETILGEPCARDGTRLRYAANTSMTGRCVRCVRMGRLAQAQRDNATKVRKRSDPSHPYHHRVREYTWSKAKNSPGVSLGIRFLGEPLRWEVYQRLLEFEGNRCPICGRDFRLWRSKQAAADHSHADGELRGVICARKSDCNLSLVGRYEAGRTSNMTSEAIEAVRRYLQAPPTDALLEEMRREGLRSASDYREFLLSRSP